MATQKRTVLDQVERMPDGHIGIRFVKQEIDEKGEVVSAEYHRTMVAPGRSIDQQMAAVNAHLVEEGHAAVTDWRQLHDTEAAARAANDGPMTLVVNFTHGLIGRRATPYGKSALYNVRCRDAFLTDCPRGQAFHDLVFTPDAIAGDDALKAAEIAEAEAASKRAEEAAVAQAAERKRQFDAAVDDAVQAALARRGIAAVLNTDGGGEAAIAVSMDSEGADDVK